MKIGSVAIEGEILLYMTLGLVLSSFEDVVSLLEGELLWTALPF